MTHTADAWELLETRTCLHLRRRPQYASCMCCTGLTIVLSNTWTGMCNFYMKEKYSCLGSLSPRRCEEVEERKSRYSFPSHMRSVNQRKKPLNSPHLSRTAKSHKISAFRRRNFCTHDIQYLHPLMSINDLIDSNRSRITRIWCIG